MSRLKLINSPEGEKLFDFNSAQVIFLVHCNFQNYSSLILLNDFSSCHVRYFCCCEMGQQFIKPDDWALWMTRLGVRNLSKPGDMGQLGSLASHEMLGESGGPLPGAAQWLRMSCTPGVHTWPGSDCTPVHSVHTWLTMGCCLVSQTWALLSRDLALARITFPIDWVLSLESKITLITDRYKSQSMILPATSDIIKWVFSWWELIVNDVKIEYLTQSVGLLPPPLT